MLSYFNAAADEYAVIFTQNATGACRLVGESYQFRPLSRFVLTADNHNSVNGIREFARPAARRPGTSRWRRTTSGPAARTSPPP